MAGTRTGLSAATDTSAARVARSASQARRCASKDATIAFRRCSTASSASCCRATAAALLVAPAAARAASPLGGVGICVCAGCDGRWRGRGPRVSHTALFSSCHAHLLHFAGPPLSVVGTHRAFSSVCGGLFFGSHLRQHHVAVGETADRRLPCSPAETVGLSVNHQSLVTEITTAARREPAIAT